MAWFLTFVFAVLWLINRERAVYYEDSLREIVVFGFSHPGYGHSCARLAEKALKDA